jgi:tetratricopeptide (TPR) repeat protein
MSSPSLVAILLLALFAPDVALAQQPTRQIEAIVAEAEQALEEKRVGDALEAFTKAVTLAPQEPSLWTAKGLTAFMLGQAKVAEDAFTRALALNPRFGDASILLGELQHQSGRVDEAIATYEAALAHSPHNRALSDRLEQWRKDARFSGRLYKSRGTHFRVLFEGPADEALARRSVEFLEDAYSQVGNTLSVYPAGTITVVLYSLQQFQDITRAPAWAGGMYDGQIRVAVKGALQHPDDLRRVLVHEFVHAVVAQIGGRTVPFWLNEGLATTLEPGGNQWASSVLDQTSGHVSLDRLHQSFALLDRDQVVVAYAQSAAAVARLMDMRGAAALVTLLRDSQRGVRFETAFHQRMAMPYSDFLAMLRR